jgi:rRNA maturation protein Nop10
MTDNITPIRTPAQILAGMDSTQLACRGQQHTWPVVIPGRKLPKGWNHEPIGGGCYQITETCSVCGRQRTSVTLPHGVVDEFVERRYASGDRWVRIPRDLGLTRSALRTEIYRRVLQDEAVTA